MVQFENPWILAVLAILVPYLIWWHRKSYADLAPRKAQLALGLRILGLLALLLALSKPVLLLENSDRSVLVLVDVSDSVPTSALESAWASLEQSSLEAGRDREIGLVLFAREPRLVRLPGPDPLVLDEALTQKLFHRRERERAIARIQELERSTLGTLESEELARTHSALAEIDAWRARIGTDETNVEAALRLARGILPEEKRRRVVLASDGNANRGAIEREIVELERNAFSVHTLLLAHDSAPEVIAGDLFLPTEAQVKAPFDLEVAIDANMAGKAEVKLYRNKYLVSTSEVELREGRNLLQLPRVRLEEGFHEFEAVVKADADTLLENNVARGAVRVAGRPKVLLVERAEQDARYLEEALRGEEIEVEVRPEGGLPRDLGDLLNYDVLVLSDVPAQSFAPGAMDAVETYVRDMGGGLVMLGGEASFGLGGYYRTPIEDALPVRMPIKKNVEKPNLSLALVIDKSGSMSGSKVELAKEAAISSAEVLKKNDRFGVVAFDSRPEWVCPMTDSSEVAMIRSTIARLIAGGGTNIYPALYEAYQALLSEDAKLKHIILLSDGQTEGSGYDALVGHIASDGITLSAVGIGDGADAQLLQNMASWGGGEYYFTNDFASVPQIFTRETMRASKSMLIEEPFVPAVSAPSEILRGIDATSMPFLLGYVATQAKELATVALVSDYGDPVLASWGYGLGRSVAFTSDAKARWAADWIGWESFAKFWGQLVRSVMSTGTHKDLRSRTRVDIADGRARVTLDVRDRIGDFRDDIDSELAILAQDGNQSPLEVEHLAPGLYRAEFPIERYGEFYRLLLVQKQAGEVVGLKAFGVTESYSPEFSVALPDEPLLRSIADRTHGTHQPDPKSYWTFEGAPARTPHDTWWWWLILAAILLPLDIALRRLGT